MVKMLHEATLPLSFPMGPTEVADLLRIPELILNPDEITFFFAHEVQVMATSGYGSISSVPQAPQPGQAVLGSAPQEASC
jgi:hypothetical protein